MSFQPCSSASRLDSVEDINAWEWDQSSLSLQKCIYKAFVPIKKQSPVRLKYPFQNKVQQKNLKTRISIS